MIQLFKTLALSLMFVLFLSPFISDASTRVNGYYKKNGTYVQPYYRSSPNSTKLDNYSTKGNVNPYTGKEGRKNVVPSYPIYIPPAPVYKPVQPSYIAPTYPIYTPPPTYAPPVYPVYTSESTPLPQTPSLKIQEADRLYQEYQTREDAYLNKCLTSFTVGKTARDCRQESDDINAIWMKWFNLKYY